MASLTVDGKVIEAPAGAPLVEVLKNNGFYVSSLCYIDGLKPYAGCRSCLVDIEGPPGLQLSCTAVVQDNMVVRTDTEEVKEGRKAVLSIILANHSDRCLTCHRREHCHPGDICLRDDVVTHRCLTCSKNYRCELQATCEMVGMSGYEPWVGEERSWYQAPQPLADRANPFMEFDPQMCIICTRCVRACDEKRHTGAITLSGRGWDARISFGAGGAIDESNCDFSGACIDVCPTATLMEHPNKWVAKPDSWATTTCDSCAVGCSLRIGSAEGRGVIVRPGDGNPVNGDQICVRGRYHYDSLKPRERLGKHLIRRGNIHAPATLAEAAAEAARALKGAGGKVGVLVGANVTNEEAYLAAQIAKALGTSADSSLGPVTRATRSALETRFGTWRMAADMTRIATSKAIVVVADDLEESHNVASVRIKDAVVRNGAKLIVIGPLRSELVDFATLWVRADAGAEGATAAAIASALGGSPATSDDVAAAVSILKDAPKDNSLVICAPNPVSAAIAGAMSGGAANLAIALFGSDASNNLVVLPPEANVHGLLDVGVAAQGAANPLEGLSAVLLVRDDPTMRLAGAAEALARAGTVIAIDNVLSDAAKAASVVIAEGRAYASAGTYTTGDHRIQKLMPAVKPEGDAVSLFEALAALGAALGVELPKTADAALGEISKLDSAYQPVWDLIIGEGVRRSVPVSAKAMAAPVEALSADAGTRIIAARDLYTALDAAAMRHPEAEKLHRYDRIQVSEEDGERLGIATGDEVTISAGATAVAAKATVTERVPAGHVFVSSLAQGGKVAQFFGNGHVPAVELARSGGIPAPRPVAATAPAAPQPVAPEPVAPQPIAAAPAPSAFEREDSDGRIPVEAITGVGDDAKAALNDAGIFWLDEYLEVAASADGRKALSTQTGVDAKMLLEWANRADLMRIPGVSAALADLLENSGVDTVKELATRKPENLHAKLADVGGALAPSAEAVVAWVESAKSLPPVITH
jgi:predicted molibdopterin-dependent oxidoreductase YjgC/predicted flap endonuclease-1-like 5' DNA nuclease